MAIEHFALGAARVFFNAKELGYSRDGVDIALDPRWNDIPSDDFGGAGGVPSDAQLLGSVAMVTAELTKFDKDELFPLATFDPNTPPFAGGLGNVVLPPIGTFVRQGATPLAKLLKLDGPNMEIDFGTAFLRQRQQFNVGTRATFWMLGFECWLNASQTRLLMSFLTATP